VELIWDKPPSTLILWSLIEPNSLRQSEPDLKIKRLKVNTSTACAHSHSWLIPEVQTRRPRCFRVMQRSFQPLFRGFSFQLYSFFNLQNLWLPKSFTRSPLRYSFVFPVQIVLLNILLVAAYSWNRYHAWGREPSGKICWNHGRSQCTVPRSLHRTFASLAICIFLDTSLHSPTLE
jgi:hypothetical protein